MNQPPDEYDARRSPAEDVKLWNNGHNAFGGTIRAARNILFLFVALVTPLKTH